MSTTYLNPKIIDLDDLDFVKMDIAPGTAQLIEVDFAIAGYGSLASLSIEVNRVAQTCTKTCGTALALAGTQFLLTKEDTQGVTPLYPYGQIKTEETDYHSNFTSGAGVAPESLLKAALFNLMVTTIFDANFDGIQSDSSLDFTDSAVRSNQVFFYSFDAGDVCGDVIDKTEAALSLDPQNGWDDECEYWNYRTEEDTSSSDPLETASVPFAANDKIWCVYDITSAFTYGGAAPDALNPALSAPNNATLNALGAVGKQDHANSPFKDATVDFKFALEWTILASA